MKLSQSGAYVVDDTGHIVPAQEIMAELTAMKVEQTRLAEKLQEYIAMWKDSQAEVERLKLTLAEAKNRHAEHLVAHRTADAHDCAEMEEMYQREKAEVERLKTALDEYEQDVFPRAERRFADAVARAEKAEAEVERLRDAVELLKYDNYRIHKHREQLEAEVERLRTAAGKFHDLYHANWMRSSPTFPDCDCELATALRGEGAK